MTNLSVDMPNSTSKIVVTVIVCVLVRMSFAQEVDKGGDSDKMDVFFLPCNTRPESYDLLIVPKFNQLHSTFGGETKIILVANEPTDSITLNALDLKINKVTVDDIGGKEPKNINVVSVDLVKKNEQLVIRLGGKLEPKRKYKVYITYEGIITNDMTGFFLSSFVDDCDVKWCAATRFISMYARKAFPCFDEPGIKAIVNVSLVKKKNQIALSNMPVLCIEQIQNSSKDEELVRFKPTPLISTYVIGFLICEYETKMKGSEVQIYTHKELLSQTKFMGKEIPKYFKALTDYTKFQLDLPKVDVCAVRAKDYDGIQNYGIMFFEECYLLLSDDISVRFKREAILIVIHRIAYYWFGNLVTCMWWDHEWIQNGLDRYFKYYTIPMVEKKLPIEEWFVYDVHQDTMQFDTLGFGPMAGNMKTPDDVLLRDPITTSFKPAAVFRMLKYLVTEKLFQLSLQDYLNNKKYSASVPDDLYASFDKVLSDNKYELGNGLTVKEFMISWAEQDGYPYINITLDKKANTFIITQNKFPVDDNEKKPSHWHIGLTYTTEHSKNFDYCKPTYWTDKKSKTTTIPAPTEPGWYIFNIQATGLYRVNYEIENWIAVTKQLNKDINAISVINRATFIDDALALALGGVLDYSVPLCLVTFLRNEEEPLVWYTAMNDFNVLLKSLAQDVNAFDKVLEYISVYFEIILKKLEDLVAKGNIDDEMLRAWDLLTAFICEYGQQECIDRTRSWFVKWMEGNKIPADIKEVAFCTGMSEFNDQQTFDLIFEVFVTSKSFFEKKAAALAIGCSTCKELLSNCIEKLIFEAPETLFQGSETQWVVQSIQSSAVGFEVLFGFISNNLDRLLKEILDGEGVIGYIYMYLALFVMDDSEIKKLKEFKDSSKIPPSLKDDLEAAFATIGLNGKGTNDYVAGIHNWNIDCCEPYLK